MSKYAFQITFTLVIGFLVIFGVNVTLYTWSQTRRSADEITQIQGAEIQACERGEGIWHGHYCDWNGN